MDIALHQTRKIINICGMTFAVLMMAFSLFWLCWILWTLFVNGFAALSWDIFTHSTPPPGERGGLANALLGSFLVTFFGALIGTPIGIFAGIYLAEFGQRSWLASTTRFINDILLSAPSIVIGLFVSVLYVQTIGHFSGWAGSIALSILVIPIVVRTTENMLRLVPNALREAAIALGAPRWKMVGLITLKAAKHGVLTGILLAIARISGETAPLLFTSFGNQFWSTDMNAPIATLPKVIFDFAMSPYEDWHQLAWVASLFIALSVLILNIVARWLGRHSRHTTG